MAEPGAAVESASVAIGTALPGDAGPLSARRASADRGAHHRQAKIIERGECHRQAASLPHRAPRRTRRRGESSPVDAALSRRCVPPRNAGIVGVNDECTHVARRSIRRARRHRRKSAIRVGNPVFSPSSIITAVLCLAARSEPALASEMAVRWTGRPRPAPLAFLSRGSMQRNRSLPACIAYAKSRSFVRNTSQDAGSANVERCARLRGDGVAQKPRAPHRGHKGAALGVDIVERVNTASSLSHQ